jgi:hypothetical protein
MIYSTVILLGLMISGLSASTSQAQSSALSPLFDLFTQALIKTFQTPISLSEDDAKFSLDIMLANDVFSLDDGLRLFIQQFLIALYNGRLHLLPDDWETRYPAYGRVINEINNVLDLLDKRTLSKISMKDIRPFIKSMSLHLLIY